MGRSKQTLFDTFWDSITTSLISLLVFQGFPFPNLDPPCCFYPSMAPATAVVQSLGAMVFLSDYLGVDGLLDTLSYTNAAGLILRTDGMVCQEPVIEDVIEGHWTQPIPKPSPTKSNKQLFQEGKTLRNPREPSHTQFKHPHHLQHRITVTSSRQVIQPYPWAPFPKKSPWYFHRVIPHASTCMAST